MKFLWKIIQLLLGLMITLAVCIMADVLVHKIFGVPFNTPLHIPFAILCFINWIIVFSVWATDVDEL